MNDEKIVISEWAEVEATDYIFDLKKKTLNIRDRLAFFMFEAKRTIQKTIYECDLRSSFVVSNSKPRTE